MTNRLLTIFLLVAMVVVAGCVSQVEPATGHGNTSSAQQEIYNQTIDYTPIEFKKIACPKPNITINTVTPLLLPNIRYVMPIKFYVNISDVSSSDAAWTRETTLRAIALWQNSTNDTINFAEVDDPDDANMIFVWFPYTGTERLGEAGPTAIVDTGLFNLSTKAWIELTAYSLAKNCTDIVVHEMGHALGLAHAPNITSTMYSGYFSTCSRPIDGMTLKTIDELYKISALPELYIEEINASKTGGKMNLSLLVRNIGLTDSTRFEILYLANANGKTSEYRRTIENIQPGWAMTVNDIFDVRPDASELKIIIDPGNRTQEIDRSCNTITLDSD
jgi:hypothetical protein